MSFGAAIVLIVLIFAVAMVLRPHRPVRGDHDAGQSLREAELQRELTELRERVRVLERIATDDPHGRRLTDQIERLRDE